MHWPMATTALAAARLEKSANDGEEFFALHLLYVVVIIMINLKTAKTMTILLYQPVNCGQILMCHM